MCAYLRTVISPNLIITQIVSRLYAFAINFLIRLPFFCVTQSLLMVLLVSIAFKRKIVPYHFYREISQQSI